jgi:3-dehydroquinate synthase
VTQTLVRLALGNYEALVGTDLLEGAGAAISRVIPASRCTLITDANVAPLLAEKLQRSLSAASLSPTLIILPAGEKSKTLSQVGTICDQMMAAGLDRQSLVVGLGGGVIGDVSGFVAAIFQRGIPHVQIPTTLLAMVDSSIGGKTGVNTSAGKNLLGAIHHPALVIDDIDLLNTLPPRELNQGFAEIVKHAIIADAEMFAELQEKVAEASRLRSKQNASETLALQSLIQRNIEIKARIVSGDELDRTGARAILNFGHTVGHAIERAGDYQQFLHGEAIALGIVAATAVSMRKAGLKGAQRDAIIELLQSFDLPTRLPSNFPREKIFDALPFDKKFERGRIRFVVTSKIGSAHLATDITMEDIRAAVNEL